MAGRVGELEEERSELEECLVPALVENSARESTREQEKFVRANDEAKRNVQAVCDVIDTLRCPGICVHTARVTCPASPVCVAGMPETVYWAAASKESTL